MCKVAAVVVLRRHDLSARVVHEPPSVAEPDSSHPLGEISCAVDDVGVATTPPEAEAVAVNTPIIKTMASAMDKVFFTFFVIFSFSKFLYLF